MSTTSTRFGMTLADGNENFDNDKFLKGPLQILDAGAAKIIETLAMAGGLTAEIVEVSFTSSGATNIITGSCTYANKYASNPLIIEGQVTQTVSYTDTMKKTTYTAQSTTGMTAKLQVNTSNPADNFGSGTAKMKFLIIGVKA